MSRITPQQAVERYRAALRRQYGDEVAEASIVEHTGSGWYRVCVATRSYGEGELRVEEALSSSVRKGQLLDMARVLQGRAEVPVGKGGT